MVLKMNGCLVQLFYYSYGIEVSYIKLLETLKQIFNVIIVTMEYLSSNRFGFPSLVICFHSLVELSRKAVCCLDPGDNKSG